MIIRMLGCLGILAIFAAPASAANVVNACGWNHPGANPYKGGTDAGIDSYKDIPAPLRTKLKARAERFEFDRVVKINRDGISGGYEGQITDMHFGKDTICRNVSRLAWDKDHHEVGVVYCEDDYCIIVPTVCGNVSRIRKSSIKHGGVKGKEEVVPFIPPPLVDGVIPPGQEVPNPSTGYHPHVEPEIVHEVPEPASLWLILLGLICILMGLKRDR